MWNILWHPKDSEKPDRMIPLNLPWGKAVPPCEQFLICRTFSNLITLTSKVTWHPTQWKVAPVTQELAQSWPSWGQDILSPSLPIASGFWATTKPDGAPDTLGGWGNCSRNAFAEGYFTLPIIYPSFQETTWYWNLLEYSEASSILVGKNTRVGTWLCVSLLGAL